jgi:hypothetical protein
VVVILLGIVVELIVDHLQDRTNRTFDCPRDAFRREIVCVHDAALSTLFLGQFGTSGFGTLWAPGRRQLRPEACVCFGVTGYDARAQIRRVELKDTDGLPRIGGSRTSSWEFVVDWGGLGGHCGTKLSKTDPEPIYSIAADCEKVEVERLSNRLFSSVTVRKMSRYSAVSDSAASRQPRDSARRMSR